jgi:hypothetical protein
VGELSERIRGHITEGEDLRSGPFSQADGFLRSFRKNYLEWVDRVHRVLREHPEAHARVESTRWQMVVAGNVSDDELVRTILGDVERVLAELRELADDLDEPAQPGSSMRVPPRWIADPGTVGIAVFDATCLFSKHTRHLLLGYSVQGIVLGRWSRELLAEAAGNLAKKLRGDSLADLGTWLKSETDLVRDGLVENYKDWLDGLNLPDPGDAHVLAAAIKCGATAIVTDNTKDFPAAYLDAYGITTATPDDFSVECINANPVLATRVVTEHPVPELLLDKLTEQLPKTTTLFRELLD